MSEYINESLLDASPIKKQKEESAKLVAKWDKSGLLEGEMIVIGGYRALSKELSHGDLVLLKNQDQYKTDDQRSCFKVANYFGFNLT